MNDVAHGPHAAALSSARAEAVISPSGSAAVCVVRKCTGAIADTWWRCQVELTGDFSIERLLALDAYHYVATPGGTLYLFFGTAVPCLIAIMVLESIPLAPIEEGIDHSRNFWFRTTIGTCMVTYSIVSQYHHGIPQLSLSARQTAFISISTTALLMPILYAMNVAIGYPMPFFVALSTVPWSPIAVSISWLLLRDQLRHNAAILTAFKNHSVIFNLQSFLIVVYPAYTYMFDAYPAHQTWLALLQPVMKLFLKNCFGYASQHLQDIKPELVVFNVEIFSSLYVSSSMQSASSWATTVVIMAVDFIQACLSIRDLDDVSNDPALRHALAGEASAARMLVPLTIQILQINPALRTHSSIRLKPGAPGGDTILTAAMNRRSQNSAATSRGRAVSPTPTHAAPDESLHAIAAVTSAIPLTPTTNGDDPNRVFCNVVSLHSLFVRQRVEDSKDQESLLRIAKRLSEDEQLLVVQKTLRLLHISEFIALIAYSEVLVPIVYSLFCIIAYTFPNGRFYTTFGGLSAPAFVATLINVLLYGSLELVSFVALDYVMRTKFRVSAFTQTAFVLETQWSMGQSKLTLWILVVLQFALQHYGSDFSFQFKWLKHGIRH